MEINIHIVIISLAVITLIGRVAIVGQLGYNFSSLPADIAWNGTIFGAWAIGAGAEIAWPVYWQKLGNQIGYLTYLQVCVNLCFFAGYAIFVYKNKEKAQRSMIKACLSSLILNFGLPTLAAAGLL